MATSFMRQCTCKHCGNIFQASRSDATRCSDCRQQYLKEHRQKPETKKRRAEQYRAVRQKAFEGYGAKCQCCGEHRFEFLAIDHVNGGGRKERETMSTRQIAKKIIDNNFPPEYRVLCHNCNQALGWYGYCPHQHEKRTA